MFSVMIALLGYNSRLKRKINNPYFKIMSSYNCDVCNKTFKKRFNLRRHINNLHAGVVVEVKYNSTLKCPLCGIGYNNHKTFIEHLPTSHDIKPITLTNEFKNNTEFMEWKKVVEQSENACYVRNHGTYKVSRNAKLVYYECHRSGVYRTRIKGERKRKVKVQGSSKIGAFCPARMKVLFGNDGLVSVEHFSTHVGHDMEMAHLCLSFEDRQKIASKIKTNTSFDTIIDEVKSSCEGKVKRTHLVTKQDLRNIVKEFSIDRDCIRNIDSVLTVDTWIKREQECVGKSCIIFHKARGEDLMEYPELKNEDFMLVVMSEAQAELLKRCGSNVVCMDPTYRTNVFDYGLVTILVLDETGQGFPCAFFFSNRADLLGLETFLKVLKNVVGVINAGVLMTDTSECWYNAWANIMNDSKLIFCTWCVKRAWKKRIDKIRDDTKRKDTLKKMFSLHSEPDEITFKSNLSAMLKELRSDSETKEFALYFEKNYYKNIENWGHCFRNELHVSTTSDMGLERIHSIIKHLFLKGKKTKRLDCSLKEIMRYVSHKLTDQPSVLEEVKVTCKLRILKERHKQSLKLNTDKVIQVSEDSWSVFSSSADEIYSVKLVDSRCTCSLSCDYCKACVHKYTCTCIDACIDLNMCKHIHLVCRKQPPATSPDPSNCGDEPVIDIHEEEINVDGGMVIIRYAGRDAIIEPTEESIECMKNVISGEFESILKNVKNVKQLHIVNETLEKLKSMLQNSVEVDITADVL